MFHLYNKDDLMSKHEQSQEKFPLLSSPNITRHTKCLTWEMCEINSPIKGEENTF